MKKIIVVLIILVLGFKATSQNEAKIIGVDIRTANPYWRNYTEEIKSQRLSKIRLAISRNISNLSLLEYSFVLDQLLVTLKSDTIKSRWTSYVNNLNKNDPMTLLSAQFLKSSIKINSHLKKDNLDQYGFVEKSLDVFSTYDLSDDRLDSLLSHRGFSETVGEGKIFDLLVIDQASTLRVITSNQKLKPRYEAWLSNLGSDAHGFWFSDDRPSEMFVRESGFVIKRLRENKSLLFQKSATAIDGIVIVRIHPNKNGYPLGYPDNPTDKDLLLGTWYGPYSENKKIIFMILKIEGNKVFGQSKLSSQNDKQLVSFEGSYSEVDKRFKLILKEPETDKPFNGEFDVIIDRFSLKMKGSWTSYNKQLKRDFEIPKNPLVPSGK
ncbi:MAG: hypothetical protein ACKVOQ_20090 [Cyclobacteriaceae bacterium]